MARTRSPRIADLSWGRMEVEIDAARRTFKDVKLFPGGAREWDWRETGTDNVPRIQPADVDELFDHGAKLRNCSKIRCDQSPYEPGSFRKFRQSEPFLRIYDDRLHGAGPSGNRVSQCEFFRRSTGGVL